MWEGKNKICMGLFISNFIYMGISWGGGDSPGSLPIQNFLLEHDPRLRRPPAPPRAQTRPPPRKHIFPGQGRVWGEGDPGLYGALDFELHDPICMGLFISSFKLISYN